MANSPIRIGPRGFERATHPNRFSDGAKINNIKHTAFQLLVFDGVSGTVTSAAFSVNRVSNFTVKTSGTISLVIEANDNPDATSGWVQVDTLTNDDIGTISDAYQFIRLRTTSASGGSATLFRRYIDGSR